MTFKQSSKYGHCVKGGTQQTEGEVQYEELSR